MAEFVETFMSTFRENVKKDAETQIKGQADGYKERIDQIQQNNAELLKETYDDYSKKQNQLGKRMIDMIDKKMTESNRRLRNELATINDDLFNDPKKLHDKIKKTTKDLENIQKEFAKEKKVWLNDDKRIAEWLGRPWKSSDVAGDEDDEKKQVDDPKMFASDLEFITINVDERTFRTYRKTLTQVEGSKIAKLFSGQCEDKQLIPYHDKSNMTYSVNCNPNIFGQVLEVLRTRGAARIEMTSALYAALLEFGIVKKFYPSLDADTLTIGGPQMISTNKKDFHVVFTSYRSTGLAGSYYPKWNKQILSSTEKKEDQMEYWQLNPQDDSEIMFLQTGYYRITFRLCQNYSSTAYVHIYINGSGNNISYRYATSANNIRSYYFNDIIQFTEGQKLKFYVSTATMYQEEKSTYLCIEKIPDKILQSTGIWKSSSSSSNYRNWNQAVKTCDRYTIKSSYNLAVNRGGLYRVSARVHTNYSSTGTQNMIMYEYRNGNNHSHTSMQSAHITNYQCHMFDEICSFKKDDYVNIYDGGYLTASSANYDCIQIQYVPFPDMIGCWRSAGVQSTYQRAWDHEYWCNDMLYSLNNTKNVIEVKQAGNYRISCNTTQYQSSNTAGYSALYINNNEYCKSRMGGYGSTYYYTTSIQEIVKLKKGDKIYIYSSNPYNSKDYNSLFIEKLI